MAPGIPVRIGRMSSAWLRSSPELATMVYRKRNGTTQVQGRTGTIVSVVGFLAMGCQKTFNRGTDGSQIIGRMNLNCLSLDSAVAPIPHGASSALSERAAW